MMEGRWTWISVTMNGSWMSPFTETTTSQQARSTNMSSTRRDGEITSARLYKVIVTFCFKNSLRNKPLSVRELLLNDLPYIAIKQGLGLLICCHGLKDYSLN